MFNKKITVGPFAGDGGDVGPVELLHDVHQRYRLKK